MTEEFQQFPQLMTHPHFRPATVDSWTDNTKTVKVANGKPMQFPPVTVNDQIQFDYHLSLGYQPSGKMNPAAFAAAKAVPDNVTLMQGHQEYPKMVGGVIVEDEGEEQARLVEMAEEEVRAASAAAAEAAREAAALNPPPDDLREQVQELRAGLTETRQGMDEIKGMLAMLLDKATAPAPAAAAGKGKDRGGDRAA